MTGIEPASQPWEGRILPMNYICFTLVLSHYTTKYV